MPTPKQRLPCSTFGRGGGGRRAACVSAVLPPVVVLVFLFVVAPSLFFVVRNGGRGHGHGHVASDPNGKNNDQEPTAMKNLKSFLPKEVFDAITASQQESGTSTLDFFRNHASPSWKTNDLVTEKSIDVDDKAKAENSLPEHDLPTNRSPKDPDEHQADNAAKVARRVIFTTTHWLRSWVVLQRHDQHSIVMEASQHLEQAATKFLSQAHGWRSSRRIDSH